MHRLLEDYMREVAAHLKTLPLKRRNAELQEIRQHLAELAADFQDEDHTEIEAASAAIRHFGSPKTLGWQVVRAWWRGRLLSLRDNSIVTALLAGFLLPLPNYLIREFRPDQIVSPGVSLVHTMPLFFSLLWVVFIGLFVGWRLSRRTPAVTASAAVTVSILSLSPILWSVFQRQYSLFLMTGTLIPTTDQLASLESMVPTVLYSLGISALLLTPATFAGQLLAKRRFA